MECREFWNGREIKGYDAELAAHIKHLLETEFLPRALADWESIGTALKEIPAQN